MVDDTGFVDLSTAAPDLPDTLRGILELDDGLERARAATDGKSADLDLSEVTLDPVIPVPSAIWAMALNLVMYLRYSSARVIRST